MLKQDCFLPYIVVPDGFEVLVQLIDQGYTGRNLKAGNVLI